MDHNSSNYLIQTINRCTHTELSTLQLVEIKKMATLLGISHATKRKDVLIDEIAHVLSASVVKSKNCLSFIAGGFPVINPENEFTVKHPMFKKIIDKYNEVTISTFPFNFHSYPQLATQRAPVLNIFNFIDPYQSLNQMAMNRMPQNPFLQVQPTKKKLTNLNCLCGFPIYTEDKDPLVRCINAECSRYLHANCCKMKAGSEESKLYECPDCTLKKCDPLHEVIEVLRTPFKLDQNKQEFMIDQAFYRRIQSDVNVGVEIRCIRIEEKSHEQTWPHQGELLLNSKKELEFKPLQQNSSLKKRKDEKFFSRNVLSGLNSLHLKFVPRTANDFPKGKPVETDTYFAAIYLVRKLSCDELIAKIKRNNIRKLEDCKTLVKDQLKGGDIEIDRVNYQLQCVLDMQPIKTPAKGAHCKHINCFSLENYIMVWFKNNQRKWLCPLCKVKSYDIIVDSYFMEILKEAKEKGVLDSETPEVTIDQSANFFFNQNDKELKPSVSDDGLMIQEAANDKSNQLKTELSKTSAGAPKKGHEETNKAAVTILLDSDDDQPPPEPKKTAPVQNPVNITKKPVTQPVAPPQTQKVDNKAPVKRTEPQNPKAMFEETKVQKTLPPKGKDMQPEIPVSKPQHKPDFPSADVRQSIDPAFAGLRGEINPLANPLQSAASNEEAKVGKMPQLTPQMLGLPGMGSNLLFEALNAMKNPGGAGKTPLGNGQTPSPMDLEGPEYLSNALKKLLLLQGNGGPLHQGYPENLMAGLYPSLYNLFTPGLSNPLGLGLGLLNNEQLLGEMHKSIMAQLQMQQQMQAQKQKQQEQVEKQPEKQPPQQQPQVQPQQKPAQQQPQPAQQKPVQQPQQLPTQPTQQKPVQQQVVHQKPKQQVPQQPVQQPVIQQPLQQTQQRTQSQRIQQQQQEKLDRLEKLDKLDKVEKPAERVERVEKQLPQQPTQQQPQQVVPAKEKSMDVEVASLETQRKELLHASQIQPKTLQDVMEITQAGIPNLLKHVETDGDMLTYEMVTGEKERAPEKPAPHPIYSRSKKIMKAFHRYLDDETKQKIQKSVTGQTKKINELKANLENHQEEMQLEEPVSIRKPEGNGDMEVAQTDNIQMIEEPPK